MQHEYRQRRERLMEKIGHGTAIFHSAPTAIMHNDVEYNFRQDSDFFYLTGFDEPEAVAVLAPHHEEHRYVLFVRAKDWEQEVWTGYRLGVDAAKDALGADVVYPISELDEKLPQYLEKADRLYYRLGRDKPFDDKILRHWQHLLLTYNKRGTGPIALEDPRFILGALRQVKSEAELDLTRQAIAIAAEAHIQAIHQARPGRYEYEIQAELEHYFRINGAMGPAYPSIVASGPNACILHYVDNKRQMQDQDLLLIDAGCACGYYNSDITRTFPINGRFTAEQKVLYELVLAAQKAAIAEVKPGNPYDQMHKTAVRVLTEGLVELGLLVGSLDQLIEEEKYKPFYMHRTGHWLGLDVHDAGIYRQGETWQTFQPGYITTVEPGLYIGPETQPAEGQPEIPDRWRGIGIRIEDDVLVTTTGHEILSTAVPKEVKELEH